MSSSYDVGYYASQTAETLEENCLKGNKHDWIHYGRESSSWGKCKKCGENYYTK